VFFFFQAEDGIRDRNVTGVQTCALPICCAYCLNMHGAEARKAGVDQQRIDVLAGWWEAPDLYTARERAALAFTEEVTNISEGGEIGRASCRERVEKTGVDVRESEDEMKG